MTLQFHMDAYDRRINLGK